MINSYYYYTLIFIFLVVCFMMAVDKNVSTYIDLLYKVAKIKIERIYWMIKLHPRNPVENFFIKRKYDKIAKELKKEFLD